MRTPQLGGASLAPDVGGVSRSSPPALQTIRPWKTIWGFHNAAFLSTAWHPLPLLDNGPSVRSCPAPNRELLERGACPPPRPRRPMGFETQELLNN